MRVLLMQKVWKVIVIGAGISGIGASLQLSMAGVQHIILECRNRLGGRIYSKQFDGIPIDLGASYVHQSDHNNKIIEIMKEIGWKTIPVNYQSLQCVLEGKGEIGQDIMAKASLLYDQLMEKVKQKANLSPFDISVADAASSYLQELEGIDEQVHLALKWIIDAAANIEATELHELSAKSYTNAESQFDVLPKGGYFKLIEAIYDLYKPEVLFNQKVIKIDYSSKFIQVHTKDNLFRAERVISSLPLGILQRKIVQFVPQLPESHQTSILKMGNGVANKIFVSFEKPFWDVTKKWVDFISAGARNRYPFGVSIVQENRFILCMFISGDASKQLNELSDEEIINDLVSFLSKFNFKEEIKVRAFEVTRWEEDPFSLGSYSYMNMSVGMTKAEIDVLRSPIDNKLWFIGEHCHSQMNACAHSAFQTGLNAASEVTLSLKQFDFCN